MASFTINGYSREHIYGYSSTYSTARSTFYSRVTNSLIVGQRYFAYNYYVYRGILKFNTGAVLSGYDVTQANIKIRFNEDYSDTDFDVQIVKLDSYSDGSATQYDYDAVDAGALDDSVWRNTAGISTATYYTSGNLDTAHIKTTDFTYYGLRSDREHAATTPSANEHIRYTSAAYAQLLIEADLAAPSSSTPIHLIRTGMQPGMRIGL